MIFNFCKCDGTIVNNEFSVYPLVYPITTGEYIADGEPISSSSSPYTIALLNNYYKVETDLESTNIWYGVISGSVFTPISSSIISSSLSNVTFNLKNSRSDILANTSIEIIPVNTNIYYSGSFSAFVMGDRITYVTDLFGSVTVPLIKQPYNVVVKGGCKNTPFQILPSGSACNAKDIEVTTNNISLDITVNNSANFGYTADASDQRYLHGNTSSSSSISSSYALTASYSLNGGSGGTSLHTGSTYPITASWSNNAPIPTNFPDFVNFQSDVGITGDLSVGTLTVGGAVELQNPVLCDSTLDVIGVATFTQKIVGSIDSATTAISASHALNSTNSLTASLLKSIYNTNTTINGAPDYSGFDTSMSASGKFRALEISLLGTNDVLIQAVPSSSLGYGIFESYNSKGLVLETAANTSSIIFSINRNEKARINGSGNLGIGTNSPVNRLDVVGNISCSVITASLFNGTASYSLNGGTTLTTGSLYPITASWSSNAQTASYWNSSSIVSLIGTKQNQLGTGSTYPITSSYALTASYVTASNVKGTVSNAVTASFIDNDNYVVNGYNLSSFGTAIRTNINGGTLSIGTEGNNSGLFLNAVGANSSIDINCNEHISLNTSNEISASAIQGVFLGDIFNYSNGTQVLISPPNKTVTVNSGSLIINGSGYDAGYADTADTSLILNGHDSLGIYADRKPSFIVSDNDGANGQGNYPIWHLFAGGDGTDENVNKWVTKFHNLDNNSVSALWQVYIDGDNTVFNWYSYLGASEFRASQFRGNLIGNATTADNATSAANADNATNADHATTSDSATTATSASYSLSASYALTSSNAYFNAAGFSIPIIQTGSKSVTTATSALITFQKTMPNTTYVIGMSANSAITNLAWSGKTINGFTSSMGLFSGNIDWSVIGST